ADQAVADPVEAGAAVLLRQRRAEQSHLRDLGYQLLREPALVEGVADDRQHALVGEPGHGVLHCALLLAEQGADVEQVVRVQGHGGAGSFLGRGNRHCRRNGPALGRAILGARGEAGPTAWWYRTPSPRPGP